MRHQHRRPVPAGALSGLHEPERLPGMVEAVERLHTGIQQKKRICIYGDYDVDGVSGTAILLTTLRLLGAEVEFPCASSAGGRVRA